MTENEALKLMESLVIDPKCELVKTLDFKATVIKALEDLQQYRAIGTVDEILKVFNNQQTIIATQHETLKQYRAIGTIDEFKALKEYKAKMEMQYLDDINNPLEPLKLSSALQSEILKYNYRKEHKPQDIIEKLIARLEEWDKHSQDGLISVMGVVDIINQLAEGYKTIDVAELVEKFGQEKAQSNDGWIPCSERLPEEDDYILVSFENFTLADIARYEEDEEGGSFYPGDDEKSYVSYGLFVNAWQPLPEPYREEFD